VLLSGTLTLPAGNGPHPAAVILAGSGRLDRDANRRGMRLGVSRDLAAALVEYGVASLRFDKRGVGASQGSWLSAGFGDNVADAKAALTWLHARSDVRANATFLIGHSEGGYIATRLGGDPVARALAGVVLLAAPARPGHVALAWQTRQIAGSLPRLLRVFLRLLRIDPVALQTRRFARIRATRSDVVRIAGRKVNAGWYREILDFDPAPFLAQLSMPVLAITGSKDLQVAASDLDIIAASVPPPVQTIVMPGLTHLLRRDSGAPTVTAYGKLLREPTDADVLATVCGWIEQHTEPSPSA
jgi:pimeloyl-ACP methyl ester carboxylesterase